MPKAKGRSKRPSKGRGTVAILAILFLGSAGLRIATSATEVFADAKLLQPKSGEATLEPHEHPSDAEIQLSEERLAIVLKEFQNREKKIKQQELDIEKRMIVLEATERRVNQQMAQMEIVEANLRETLALASTAAEDDLARLTAVYESMKPKTTAALFEEMDPEFAAGFVARMRSDAAALVMAGMSPQAAYSISTILAGRNANVPKE